MLMSKTPLKQNTSQPKSHKVRTFFAALAGIVSIYLILASITVVWLNQTLTNTTTYVNTVAPLIKKPAIQNFIASKVTTQILNNAPTQQVANALLTPSQLSGNPSIYTLKTELTPIINSNVITIVSSNSFATLWKQTNETAHAALITQLNNDSGQIQLNLSPAINGVINELKASKLSPVANQINISPNTGVLDIKNSGVSKAHHYYKLFNEGTIAIVIAAILSLALAIILSVNHVKTIRRILLGLGILSLLEALIFEIPVILTIGKSDQSTQGAVHAFSGAIFHNIVMANIVLGIICIGAAIGSKIYTNQKSKK